MKLTLLTLLALSFAIVVPACADEPGGPGPEAPDAAVEASPLVWCPPGYHPHRVQWATRQKYWGTCTDVPGPSLSAGTWMCMQDGNYGVSCGGNWYVPACGSWYPNVQECPRYTYGVRIEALH